LEAEFLKELRSFLTLTNDELLQIETETIHPRYQKALNQVLIDGFISPEENHWLELAGAAYRLDPVTAKRLQDPQTVELINRKLDSILSDRRISLVEERELEELSTNLQTALTLSTQQQADKRLFALYWQVENGPMPWYEVPIKLQKSERCHFASTADWYELRTKTIRANYSGVSYRIRIAKGLYYRVGSVKVAPVKKDELMLIDSGHIYFTNKRIIFDGSKGNKTVRLTALLSVEPYEDGIGLEKETGKSPVIRIGGNVALATIVLSTLLAKSD
jgi:hypothetical protein